MKQENIDRINELARKSKTPEGLTEDGYGVYLCETDFYRYSPAAQVLPDNLVLCILEPTLFGGSSNEETYRQSVAFFRAMADYRVKE